MSTLRWVKHSSKYISTITNKRFLNNKANEFIQVTVKGESLKFPSVWLRDNCTCGECYHHSAQSRIIDWSKFDIDVKPGEVREDNNSISIAWSDGHKSVFQHDWLERRSFTSKAQRDHDCFYKPEKVTWNNTDFLKILKRHQYNEVINSERHLYEWLHDLSVYGVVLIGDAPPKEDAVDAIIAKVGFIKKTHYGEKFIVENRQDTSNVAYLSSNLQLHTDLPYYEYCPGVNILHFLTQTQRKGGNNLLSDSHYVAYYMREHHPDEYNLLTSTRIEWSDIGVEFGNEFHKLYRSPVICEDVNGGIERINFSIPQRGSYFLTELKKVKPWYRAHKLFLELSHKFAADFKTNTGEMLCFDNIRLLHGRNKYVDSSNNIRKLIGAYLDWDEIYSRLRCLKIKLDSSVK